MGACLRCLILSHNPPKDARSSDRPPTSPQRANTCFHTRPGKNFRKQCSLVHVHLYTLVLSVRQCELERNLEPQCLPSTQTLIEPGRLSTRCKLSEQNSLRRPHFPDHVAPNQKGPSGTKTMSCFQKMEPRKGLRKPRQGFLAQWSDGTRPCIGDPCRRNWSVSVQRSGNVSATWSATQGETL